MILFIKLFDLQVPDNDIPKNILNKLHGIQTPKTFYLKNTNNFKILLALQRQICKYPIT